MKKIIILGNKVDIHKAGTILKDTDGNKYVVTDRRESGLCYKITPDCEREYCAAYESGNCKADNFICSGIAAFTGANNDEARIQLKLLKNITE